MMSFIYLLTIYSRPARVHICNVYIYVICTVSKYRQMYIKAHYKNALLFICSTEQEISSKTLLDVTYYIINILKYIFMYNLHLSSFSSPFSKFFHLHFSKSKFSFHTTYLT